MGAPQQMMLAQKIAGGAANNVVVIGTPGGIKADNATLVAYPMPSNVTSGNVVMVGVAQALDGWTPAFGDLTKTAGTATIGTVVLDQSTANSSAGRGLAIFRVPITGSGSLTLSCTNAGRGGNYWALGAVEFSGFNATPLSTTSTNTGLTSATATTGSISTTNPGVIFFVSAAINLTDFTYTASDTIVFSVGTASTTMTGIIQYKIINSSPNTLTATTGADVAASWYDAYAAYKSS